MVFLKKSNSSKSDSDKSDGKKSLFSRTNRKAAKQTDAETVASTVVPAQQPPKNGTIAPGPTSLVKHTKSFDKRILQTEQNVQNEIQKASNRKDLRLQTTGGVLLFEGMSKEELDEYSMKELKEVDAAIDDTNNGTDFVNVPANYDPVKSGFYSKKSKNYYDSDEEEKNRGDLKAEKESKPAPFCGCLEF
jgi:hypothetical protein